MYSAYKIPKSAQSRKLAEMKASSFRLTFSSQSCHIVGNQVAGIMFTLSETSLNELGNLFTFSVHSCFKQGSS